jgi:hypothetical protein
MRSCSAGTSIGSTDPARVELTRLAALALLLAPARDAAGEVAGEVRDPDRGGEARGAQGVRVVAPDQHDLAVAVGDPGELGPEPGTDRRLADRPGDVRVVVLQLGAHVDEQGAFVALDVELARAERLGVDRVLAQRPAVERDDGAEVRRLRLERGGRLVHERVLVIDAEQPAVGALVGGEEARIHTRAMYVPPTAKVVASSSRLA